MWNPHPSIVVLITSSSTERDDKGLDVDKYTFRVSRERRERQLRVYHITEHSTHTPDGEQIDRKPARLDQ